MANSSVTAQQSDRNLHATEALSDKGRWWLALGAAVLLHLAIIVPAVVIRPDLAALAGDDVGAPEAVNVMLVTEADLEARSMDVESASLQPSVRNGSQTKARAEPAQSAIAPAAIAHSQSQSQSQSQSPTPDSGAAPALDLSLAIPKDANETAHQSLSKELEAAQQAMAGPPKSASAAAPAHKGKIDEFTRAVAQALARHKPQSPGGHGRVVVKFALSESGTPISVNVTQSSGDPRFDAVAADAVWSCSFPAPPPGTSLNDRTIDIEYNF